MHKNNTTSRLWTSLALSGVAVALPVTGFAQTTVQPADMQGEAGEAGLAMVADPDAAYAIRLALVDAHLRAALEAHRAGMIPEAIGLAGHPEAEVMEELRPDMEARGASDFSPALETYADLMAQGVDDETLLAAYEGLSADIALAMHAGGTSDAVIFEAIHALVKGSAIEYADMTAAGTEPDPAATLEALGFLAVARDMATTFAESTDPVASAAGTKALDALRAATSLLAAATEPDPTILHGAAARVELAGLRLK